jgi:hypothetical protein
MDYLSSIAQRGSTDLGPEDSDFRKGLLKNTRILCKILQDMGLTNSLISAEKLENAIGKSTEIGQGFCNFVDEINGRIEDEMGSALCFIINREDAKFYRQEEPIFWPYSRGKVPGIGCRHKRSR